MNEYIFDKFYKISMFIININAILEYLIIIMTNFGNLYNYYIIKIYIYIRN